MVAMARVRLSNQRWSEIAKAGGLPRSARQKIEGVLANYRMFQQSSASEPRARQTRKVLLDIAKLAGKLHAEILDVNPGLLHGSVEPNLLDALMLPTARVAGNPRDLTADDKTAAVAAILRSSGTPTKRDAVKRLQERVLTIELLRRWFEIAALSLPHESRGAHRTAENNEWLVRQLDVILAESSGRKGRQIRRTYKDDKPQRYIELCFAAADPNVSGGSIKNAIKAHIALTPRPGTAAS